MIVGDRTTTFPCKFYNDCYRFDKVKVLFALDRSVNQYNNSHPCDRWTKQDGLSIPSCFIDMQSAIEYKIELCVGGGTNGI